MINLRQVFLNNAKGFAVIFTAITIAGSVMPGEQLGSTGFSDIPNIDKIVHLVMYAILAFLWAAAMRNQDKYLAKSFLIALTIGILMEFVQFYFLVGRFYEIFDIIANIIGSMIGIVFYSVLFKTNLPIKPK